MKKWKKIEGFSDYEVSYDGKVRGYKKPGPGKETLNLPHDIKPFISRHGYPMVSIKNDCGIKKNKAIHRLVATAFIPNPKGFSVVCHKDDNPKNNSYRNLYWGTQKDNIRDEIEHGHYHNNMTKKLNVYGRALAQKSYNEPRRIKVIGTNLDTGEEKEFESYSDASNKLGISRGSIRYCAIGERTHAGNWSFRKKENGN